MQRVPQDICVSFDVPSFLNLSYSFRFRESLSIAVNYIGSMKVLLIRPKARGNWVRSGLTKCKSPVHLQFGASSVYLDWFFQVVLYKPSEVLQFPFFFVLISYY